MLRSRFGVLQRVLIVELERVIGEASLHGPVVVAGDFNAHLGVLGGNRE